MATFLCYGNFNGKYGDKFSYDILYDILEQSIAGNYSRVRLYGYIRSWGYSGSGSTARCYINGQQIGTFTSITTNQYSQIGYLDITVNHNADGTASTTVTGLCDTPWTIGDASCSGTLTLPTIPRTSPITCTDGLIESSVSININRASDSFIHTLRYTFGSLSGTIATGVATSYGWTIPSTFYTQIPNSKSGIGTLYCDTYNNGTLIGTSSCNFNAYTDESKCKPDVSAIIVDTNTSAINLTGDSNTLIKFISNPKITITATAKNSSSISNRTVSCGDGKSGSGTEVTLNKVESGNFTVSATDSRGYTTSIPITKDLIEYINLTLNPDFYRPEPTTGEVKLSYDGNYFAGSFGTIDNSLTVKYRYKESTVSSWDGIEYTSITPTIDEENNKYSGNVSLGTGFDYQKSYDFEIIATDKLNSISQIVPVSKGIHIRGTFEKFFEYWGIKSFSISDDGTTLIINGDIKISGSNKLLKDLLKKGQKDERINKKIHVKSS